MAGKIQGADVKTEAELISAGATASSLIRDTQIYVSADSINKTLDDAILDGEFGGAGSGSLKWVDGVPSANTIVEASIESHTFSSGDSQSIYTVVKVPVSYKSGKPISLRLLIYIPDASGTYLIQSVSTLIRTGTDAFSSTTNQRTSTNTALTASGGTQNIAQQIILDITSTIGQINGVNVNAGHYIIIKIQRGTDTAVSDVRVLSHAAEVTFK